MRIDKLLSNLGLCSRSETKVFLTLHNVTCNGETVLSANESVDPSLVQIDEEQIIPPGCLTLILNKPVGYTCSHKDLGNVIYDLLPEEYIRRKPLLSSVGRLDKDSSGLLIMTDDGTLNHKLTSPKKQIRKKYLVTTREPFTKEEASVFSSGTFILSDEDKPLLPAHLEYRGTHTCEVTLYEGRNRQIRRMFEAIGNEVRGLHRISIGELSLGELNEGDWRIATAEDIICALKG